VARSTEPTLIRTAVFEWSRATLFSSHCHQRFRLDVYSVPSAKVMRAAPSLAV